MLNFGRGGRFSLSPRPFASDRIMKKIKHVYYTYKVTDNFGNTKEYDTAAAARNMEHHYAKERKMILNYIRPKGITLVLSKDTEHYVKCIPAFIGYNGVPLCECNKDKNRDFYMSQFLFADDGRSFFGNLFKVIKESYEFASEYCNYSFDHWRGAYHDRWDAKYGNNAAIGHISGWSKGVLWYHWDGDTFTTNDKKCKLTSENFK